LFYELVPGVREILLASVREADQKRVLRTVSRLIERETGRTVDFGAVLAGESIESSGASYPVGQRFAQIARHVLRRLNHSDLPVPTADQEESSDDGVTRRRKKRCRQPQSPHEDVATVTIGRLVGSAYVVSERLAITGAYSGLSSPGIVANLSFRGGSLAARVCAVYPAADVTILELQEPFDEVMPLNVTFGFVDVGTPCTVFGMDGSFKVTVTGVVPSPDQVKLLLDSEAPIPAGLNGAPVVDGDRILGHLTAVVADSDRRAAIAVSVNTVCDLLWRYSRESSGDIHRRELWHPAADFDQRGSLTPCHVSVLPESAASGKHRWESRGDLRVRLLDLSAAEAVYLLPSRFAPRQFQDSRQLKRKAGALKEKQSISLQFAYSVGSESLPAFLFHKTMSTGARHLHVYVPAYDAYLARDPALRLVAIRLADYAQQYEDIRRNMEPSFGRTTSMNVLVSQISEEALRLKVSSATLRQMYRTGRDGFRLVSLACCIGMTDDLPLELAKEAIREPRTPFEQWCALSVIQSAVDNLDVFKVESCMLALLDVMDDAGNLINVAPDSSRRQIAQGILSSFARAVGFQDHEWTPGTLRLWLRDGNALPATQPCVAVLGSAAGPEFRALCVALGAEFAANGWLLKTGLGPHVGSDVALSFSRLAADSLTAFGRPLLPTSGVERPVPYPVTPARDIEDLRRQLLEGVDVAIVIGGRDGTRRECEMALAAGIPVLPIATTGGTAAQLATRRAEFMAAVDVPQAIINLLDVEDTPARQALRIERIANIVATKNRHLVGEPQWSALGDLAGHHRVVLHTTWHPNGQLLATASVDTTTRIWDCEARREVARLRGHRHGVNQAAWSPDPGVTMLATCSFDRSIAIWSTQDWQLIRKIENLPEDVRDIAWAPDSRRLAAATVDGCISLWDTQTGARLGAGVRLGAGSPHRLLWANIGSLVSCWENGKIHVYETSQMLEGPGGELLDMTYNPRRQWLAACSWSGHVRVWSWPKLEIVTDLKFADSNLRSLSFSPGGDFLAVSSYGQSGEIHVLHADDWSSVPGFPEPTSTFWVSNIGWSPVSNRLATLGNNDRSVRLFDLHLPRPGEGVAGSAAAMAPPTPGPVSHFDDPQKDRWGGRSQRDGRSIEVVLLDVNEGTFHFSAIIRCPDGTTLEGPVIFHLHDTYPRSVIRIWKIRGNSTAVLENVSSYGVYTIGVQVRRADGSWTALEFDLNDLPQLPKRFADQ